MMGKILWADIASGFFSSGSFDLRKEGFSWKLIPVSSEVFTKGFRHIKLKWSFMFKTKFLHDYDTIIFSGDSLSAVRNAHKDTKKIYYCHTPPRYLYDLHELYLEKVAWYMKPAFKLACSIFRWLYERDLKKIDLILTNSKNTQTRIKKYLGYDSKVLYPPVDTSRFVPGESKWYFLSFARLADAKRVDKIVDAFCEIPEERLIVIYGKNDPQRDKIFSRISDTQNIECITLEDNNDLYDYIARCRATIYIPIDEDFGMSPVESMSAGKPVIWVNEWGLKETIIHNKTWFLIPPWAPKDKLIKAIRDMTEQQALTMKDDCIKQAQNFWLKSFEKQLKSYT